MNRKTDGRTDTRQSKWHYVTFPDIPPDINILMRNRRTYRRTYRHRAKQVTPRRINLLIYCSFLSFHLTWTFRKRLIARIIITWHATEATVPITGIKGRLRADSCTGMFESIVITDSHPSGAVTRHRWDQSLGNMKCYLCKVWLFPHQHLSFRTI